MQAEPRSVKDFSFFPNQAPLPNHIQPPIVRHARRPSREIQRTVTHTFPIHSPYIPHTFPIHSHTFPYIPIDSHRFRIFSDASRVSAVGRAETKETVPNLSVLSTSRLDNLLHGQPACGRAQPSANGPTRGDNPIHFRTAAPHSAGRRIRRTAAGKEEARRCQSSARPETAAGGNERDVATRRTSVCTFVYYHVLCILYSPISTKLTKPTKMRRKPNYHFARQIRPQILAPF
jgi:hypothetical protein